ncbi:hypothetical protein NHX12_019845 [Muraenolepis orangiensis]|uniref:Reverse transcriptase domain-containing protein n=1 Tax=Muraenolepis orangiensis TaxID=630683 RepID=A0A9Q0IWF3_9TELE|nr:hypothetical protein NHX12_019845 [Muraenolepis orangiensis]
MDQKIEQRIREIPKQIQKSWAEAATDSQDKAHPPDFRNIVREAFVEQKKADGDRELRANNIVIFRAKESDGTSPEQRTQDDTAFFDALCDFNYPGVNWVDWTTKGESTEAADYKFIEACRDSYLHQHVMNPTRDRIGNQPNLLDLVLTNEEDMVASVTHLGALRASDHCVLLHDLNCYVTLTPTAHTRYVYDKGDYAKLREILDLDWDEEPPGEIPRLPHLQLTTLLERLDISTDMVYKKLQNLNTSKSPGPDSVSPRVLHEAAPSLAKLLAHIFQTSLRSQKLPEKWMKANISAIFKKGDKQIPANYRPVSLTSIPCKIMDSILRDKIVDFLKENDLLSHKQYGFISGRSTSLQLLKVLDDWTDIIDRGGQIDFMRAFDMVPHRRLIGKVETYGIRDSIKGWLEDFLKDRSQQVVVNGVKSTPMAVTSGIPQGSVLGPLLFVIYINDLPAAVRSQIYLFADDTKIYRRINSDEDRKTLQACVEEAVLKATDGPRCLLMTSEASFSSAPRRPPAVLYNTSMLDNARHEDDFLLCPSSSGPCNANVSPH